MLCSNDVQSFNSKYFIFEDPQNWQNLTDFKVVKVYIVYHYDFVIFTQPKL
jgi:hypothetical protein